MKKLLASLFLLSFVAVLIFPLVASADVSVPTPNSCKMKRTVTIGGGDGAGGVTCTNGTSYAIDGDKSICCVMNTIYNFTDWFFVILVGIATIFIIVGAMNIIFGAGSGKMDSGRNYIMYAAIGLAVAFIARAIPGLIVRIIQ
ncbi:MAG: hypothetical protein PHW72_00890 [Candidatus Pacebacteria bacterium]|nr:hypothetical protein [Candidatus Paceibacterota bacterium]